MKFAVSSTGKTLDADVDPRFGRAPFFVIVDSGTGEVVSVLDNSTAINAAHGAGINAAAMVADAGVDAVITGRVGPKALAVLEKAGVKIISDASGTVAAAVRANLAPSEGPEQATVSAGSSPAGRQGGCRRGNNTPGAGGNRGQGGGCGCGRGRGRQGA